MDNIQWDKLAPIMLDNSERWFPALHDTRHSALVHFTLGLAGEVGELVEAIYTSGAKWDADLIASELADVVTYTCDIAAVLGLSNWLAQDHEDETSIAADMDIIVAAGLIANIVKKANRDADPEAAMNSKLLEILTHIRQVLSSAELLAEESEIDLLAAIEAKVLVCEARWG